MRLFRALSAALVLVSCMLVLVAEPGPARAQDIQEAEEEADTAREQAEEAASLLSDAASRRAGIEDELAASLTRLSELGAELSRVSVQLDDLRSAVERANEELATLGQSLTVQAVDAYVRAVTAPAASVVGTQTAESAMVAATSLDSTVGSDQAELATLVIKRRELETLRRQYAEEQERVEELQEEVDAETAHLEGLLAEADTEVARAAAKARAADAEYRQALDAVDLARARQKEKERQEERATTTTTTTTVSTPTTTTTTSPDSPPTTTPTTSPPPETFPAAVERWRSVVAAHFPPDRVNTALSVIQCESNGDPDAYNPYSGASGLFQFLPGTWATVSPRAGYDGASVFDPEANIGTAAWLSDYYASRGSDPWTPWVCGP
ncbi:MAG: transglycosylase SLT domain-containing protein [Actinomycetota bacterium]